MIAGTAKIDITPQKNILMDGMIRAHPSEGVHDPLFARALVLSNDEDIREVCAIVSIDICGLTTQDADAARAVVQSKVGIPAERIILAATHTHSGPATIGYFNEKETEYVSGLLDKVVQVIREAVDHMQPVIAGFGSGIEETISHYRRLLTDDGRVVMNWEPFPPERIVGPLGEIDPEVGVLKISDHHGQIVCILFNHAGHPNVLSGENYLLSAEYPGLATLLLEKEFGGAAIFVNGAQGTMDIDGLQDRDWEGMERIGNSLFRAVADTVRAIRPTQENSVRCDQIQYALPARKITEEEWTWARGILEQTGGRLQPLADGVGDDYKALLYARLRESEGQAIPVKQVGVAITTGASGEAATALISFPGELFTEIGMRIKTESPFPLTYIIGLANGSIGYIPSRRAIGEGGYAVDTRRVDTEAEDIIVANSLDLLERLYQSKS